MTTWQLFSDSANDFRWRISDEQISSEEDLALPPLHVHRLPSMADLLLQGCAKLLENGTGDSENTPMFRTGLGKSVTVNQASISRALSILGGEHDEALIGGHLGGKEDGFSFSNSIFQNNSGNTENMMTPSKNTVNASNSMFRTGSGKTVNISATGLSKAKALLGLVEDDDIGSVQGFEGMKKKTTSNLLTRWQSPSYPDQRPYSSVDIPVSPFNAACNSSGYDFEGAPDCVHSNLKPPPIKFHTACGRSISISSDALQRARSLLGDLELENFLKEEDGADPNFPFSTDRKFSDNFSCNENGSSTPFHYEKTANSKGSLKNFTSPLRSISYVDSSAVRLEKIGPGNNLIQRFDAEADDRNQSNYCGTPCHRKPLSSKYNVPKGGLTENGISTNVNQQESLPRRPFSDITNNAESNKQNLGEKRRLGIRSSPSPFKRPRSSRFVTPLNKTISSVPNMPTLAPKESCLKARVSTRYPFQITRPYVREYVEEAPHSCQNNLENLPDHVRKMNSTSAVRHMFQDESGSNCVGAESFYHMLSHSGVYISKEWVENHYRWIVWKLACYERCFSGKFSGKLLTVPNVLEELKYRYEREVNHGHRSAIKRILEGDAQPSSGMVLCVASVCAPGNLTTEYQTIASNGAENCPIARIELTDGWYSIYAVLDVLLSKKLASGKIFIGQKLRIWGAGLIGSVGPASPLEAPNTTSLQLHMNGTYRAHWADRLGFSKEGCLPLAFRSIKCAGGPIPCTLVRISRVYPVSYRERVSGGRFIVRSERMESKAVHSFNQRRYSVVEGIMSNIQKINKDSHVGCDQDSEEGAKISSILETAAEPELLMAEMTSEQLSSFASYQTKLEVRRQSDIQRSVEQALEAAGLSDRDVTPFMRVRVVGLTRTFSPQSRQLNGLITVWNPTEKQKSDLIEGQAYAVAGLVPVSSDSTTLYLQARGSTIKWLLLSHLAIKHFKSFFCPRRPISVSKLGDVALSSEFDIAAFVIHVGEVYTAAHQMKQWVFVTNESSPESHSGEPLESLLAIKFCSSFSENDMIPLVNHNLVGSTVGFCNLIKRAKDNVHNMWVAEATENSTYFLNYEHRQSIHLKDSAKSVQNWARISNLAIEKLKGKVASIIGHCRSEL